MATELSRILLPYLVVFMVVAAGFYSLVLSPYELDDLVKGAIIGFVGAAIQWVFGTATAGTTARQQQAATASGATAGATVPASMIPTGTAQTTTTVTAVADEVDPIG